MLKLLEGILLWLPAAVISQLVNCLANRSSKPCLRWLTSDANMASGSKIQIGRYGISRHGSNSVQIVWFQIKIGMSYYMYIVSMVWCIYYDYFLRILTVFSYISGIELWQTGATIVVLATHKSLQWGSTRAKICEHLETPKIPHWRVSYAKDSPGNHAQLEVEAPGSGRDWPV